MGLSKREPGVYAKRRGERVPEWDRPFNYRRPEWEDGHVKDIRIRKGLPADEAARLLGHEVGHAVDDVVGTEIIMAKNGVRFRQMPHDDATAAQQAQIYRDLNRAESPQAKGYPEKEVQGELNAEALRAALTGPNYLKTIAPDTAARLREFVNTHRWLSRYVHLNSLVGLGLLGPAAGLGLLGGVHGADDASPDET